MNEIVKMHIYNKFNEIVTQVIKRHLKPKIVKYDKHKKFKWVTKGRIKSITTRDKMYPNLKLTAPDDPDYIGKKINLRTYNRILKQNIRHAKRRYFESC